MWVPTGAMGIRSPEGEVIEACELPEVDAGNQTHWEKKANVLTC